MMVRKQSSDKDAPKMLREIDFQLHDESDIVSSCCKTGIPDKNY